MLIESYSFGKLSINGKIYHTDLIIFPDRVHESWWRKEGHNLSIEDIRDIFVFDPEILIIGQGSPGYMQVSENVRMGIQTGGIELFVSGTQKAVEMYNKTFGSRKTVAALHLTC